MHDPALWKRIQAHQFDASQGTAPFSVKLAAAEGWPKAYTNQVIEEYRRFVYLTQISDAQVTPSQAVDRAWHMHLTFTRDYWDVFCLNVLGKPLHHDPCAGEEEMPRYRAQFEQTKALYMREFGGPAPIDIWEMRVDWRTILTGGAIGAIGSIILFWTVVGGETQSMWPLLSGFALIAGGWGYAMFKLPQVAVPDRDKANGDRSAGCGGGGCGGGGCGGCGG